MLRSTTKGGMFECSASWFLIKSSLFLWMLKSTGSTWVLKMWNFYSKYILLEIQNLLCGHWPRNGPQRHRTLSFTGSTGPKNGRNGDWMVHSAFELPLVATSTIIGKLWSGEQVDSSCTVANCAGLRSTPCDDEDLLLRCLPHLSSGWAHRVGHQQENVLGVLQVFL